MASPAEIDAAALQFVRKISGFRRPSARNEEAFDRAVAEIAESSQRLLEAITRAAGTTGTRTPTDRAAMPAAPAAAR